MNVRRILTAAAAGSALLAAVAPAAQAAPAVQAGDLGGALSSTAQSASAVRGRAEPVAERVVGDKVGAKVRAVRDAAQAGGDLLTAGKALMR